MESADRLGWPCKSPQSVHKSLISGFRNLSSCHPQGVLCWTFDEQLIYSSPQPCRVRTLVPDLERSGDSGMSQPGCERESPVCSGGEPGPKPGALRNAVDEL